MFTDPDLLPKQTKIGHGEPANHANHANASPEPQVARTVPGKPKSAVEPDVLLGPDRIRMGFPEANEDARFTDLFEQEVEPRTIGEWRDFPDRESQSCLASV